MIAATLGAIFLFSGVINEVVYVAAQFFADRNGIRDVRDEFLGFTYLVTEVYPWLTAMALAGTPIVCSLRTRSYARGVVATVLAISVMVAGEIAIVAPSPIRYCLLSITYPGWIVAEYVEPHWGSLVTMFQVVLGVVLLNAFRRPGWEEGRGANQ